MRNVVAAAGALALGAALAGCGHSSHPQVQPDLAGKPTWGDCQEHSMHNLDYISDAHGKPTANAALASYRTDGDHVVVVPARAHQNRRWLLVDDTNLIHTALEMQHVQHGWLVDLVETCSD